VATWRRCSTAQALPYAFLPSIVPMFYAGGGEAAPRGCGADYARVGRTVPFSRMIRVYTSYILVPSNCAFAAVRLRLRFVIRRFAGT
jgi:hypothetical protein